MNVVCVWMPLDVRVVDRCLCQPQFDSVRAMSRSLPVRCHSSKMVLPTLHLISSESSFTLSSKYTSHTLGKKKYPSAPAPSKHTQGLTYFTHPFVSLIFFPLSLHYIKFYLMNPLFVLKRRIISRALKTTTLFGSLGEWLNASIE